MTTPTKSKVYGAISNNFHDRNAKHKHISSVDNGSSNVSNEIEVIATGEVSRAPDRCRVLISISSTKDIAQDAKNSVTRRLDYILQTLQNEKIQVLKPETNN